ncbi:MAG: exonuclease subunit SbcD [Candidatus Muiribacteriota bacterium]
MKFLHTSDWHIGKKLYNKTRYHEFEKFFNWLQKVIKEENIDILIVSGDVFDTISPSNRAQEIYFNFLKNIISDSNNISNILITGGNHDSPSFLEASASLLKSFNIFVTGSVSKNIENHIFVLNDKKNNPLCVFCAVPYLRDKDIRKTEDLENIDDKFIKNINGIKDFYEKTGDIAFNIKKQNNLKIPVIATGHLFTAGAKTFENDGVRELYVGNVSRVGSDVFPDIFDYVALGHLHSAQTVDNKNNIRFSGAPLFMSFSDSSVKKVIVGEFEDNLIINEIEVPCFQKSALITGNTEKIKSELLQLIEKNESVWVEISYNGNNLDSDYGQTFYELVKNSCVEILKFSNLNIIKRVFEKSEFDKSLEELDDIEVFEKCLDVNKIYDDKRIHLVKLYKNIRNKYLDRDKE